ncbi:histidine phosphatase family protein [Paenibacillus sp. CMAA1364]
MEIELVCIRHGRTQWNQDRRYLGHTDIGLLPSSRTDLIPLKDKLTGRSFHKVFCSDLKRCRETLEWIYPTSPDGVIFDERLREMDFGEWEGQTYDELQHSVVYREWLDNPQEVTPPRGEDWEHFNQRLTDFLDYLVCDMNRWNDESCIPSILIVTHGGVIRQLTTMMIPGLEFWDVNVDPGDALSLKLSLMDGEWIGRL